MQAGGLFSNETKLRSQNWHRKKIIREKYGKRKKKLNFFQQRDDSSHSRGIFTSLFLIHLDATLLEGNCRATASMLLLRSEFQKAHQERVKCENANESPRIIGAGTLRQRHSCHWLCNRPIGIRFTYVDQVRSVGGSLQDSTPLYPFSNGKAAVSADGFTHFHRP